MWAPLVQMRSKLQSESMNMRYEKGADLREQFNMVRIQYEALSNAVIPISVSDHRSLFINFVPPELSSFLVTDLASDVG